MALHHVGHVTNLSDLASFMSVLRLRGITDNIHVVLVAGAAALPQGMRTEFHRLGQAAFPHCSFHVAPMELIDSVNPDWGPEGWTVVPDGDTHIVYVNHIHKENFASIAASASPDHCVFFDQGLVSYGDTGRAVLENIARFNLPPIEHAYLTLSPPFDVPGFLNSCPVQHLTHEDLWPSLSALRRAETSEVSEYSLPSALLVGTHFWKGGRLTFREERDIYLQAVRRLSESGHERIAFKSHPRAGEHKLLTEDDGVEVIHSEVPVEAFLVPGQTGVVESISSTTLVYLSSKLGWTANLLSNRKTKELLRQARNISHITSLGNDFISQIDPETGATTSGVKQSNDTRSLPLFGVPVFSYENFEAAREEFETAGSFDVNVGDYFQSLASTLALRRAGVASEQIKRIDRDTLPTYAGPPVHLIMNGVFYDHCFPLPDTINPIFLGFRANRQVLEKHLDIFRKCQPIGCRDEVTRRACEKLGLEAFVTGCLTMTLPKRRAGDRDKILVVYGTGAGELPAGLLNAMPEDIRHSATFLYHRLPVFNHPVPSHDRSNVFAYARRLWNLYRDEAKLVITPLHHVATPCLAAGVPVILARRDNNARFSYLKDLFPVYTPDMFDEIDWNPSVVDIEFPRERLDSLVKQKVELALRMAR